MRRAALLVALLAPSAALATAGYFQIGYGLKAKGLGGAAAAFPQDSLAAATNPAGMVWVGDRVDVGLEWFAADRGSRISGNTQGLNGERDASHPQAFPLPEIGANRMLDARRSLGVSVYAAGGSTSYDGNPFASLGGASSPAGMDFQQGVVAPAFAAKLGERHSLGVALNFVYQRFRARGLEHFDDPAFSAAPGSVTNRGWDQSLGLGVRVGWLGRVAPALTLGAAWQPKTPMQKFERYKGLLADGGSFDVPENYVAGAAFKATASLALVGDVQRILYSRVRSLGNRADCLLDTSCLLGTRGGPGAGWRDVTVYKLGGAYELSPRTTLRAGVALLRQPVPESQTLLNIFAPAVSETHLALGATWRLGNGELTFSYVHALAKTVAGRSSIPAGPPPGGVGGGEADIRMRQRALGVAYGWAM
jgi:long-chain fatty acid transport protein